MINRGHWIDDIEVKIDQRMCCRFHVIRYVLTWRFRVFRSFYRYYNNALLFTQNLYVPGRLPSRGPRDLGRLVISVPYVRTYCETEQECFEERMPMLLAHGICHLMGYVSFVLCTMTPHSLQKHLFFFTYLKVRSWNWRGLRNNAGRGDSDLGFDTWNQLKYLFSVCVYECWLFVGPWTITMRFS